MCGGRRGRVCAVGGGGVGRCARVCGGVSVRRFDDRGECKIDMSEWL